MNYLLGIELGSSYVKGALINAATGKTYDNIHLESTIGTYSPYQGWKEQCPSVWWAQIQHVTHRLLQLNNVKKKEIISIGLCYPINGLILIDKRKQLLRPCISSTDVRAREYGIQARQKLGLQICKDRLHNPPGNFVASRLHWIRENEPEIYDQIYKILTPGEYIHLLMTGEISTTVQGLSESMLWDFKDHKLATSLMEYYELDKSMIPEVVDAFSNRGELSKSAASFLGLKRGTPISFLGNNKITGAMALSINKSGEVASVGGNVGSLVGLTDVAVFDETSRTNNFAYFGHQPERPRIAMISSVNGAAENSQWIKNLFGSSKITEDELEVRSRSIPIGSEGLRIIPYGYGSEQSLGGLDTGAQINNLQFSKHTSSHLLRASLEGLAFAYVNNFQRIENEGHVISSINSYYLNLFNKSVFAKTVANLIGCEINLHNTNGAIAAGKASGISLGLFNNEEEAFAQKDILKTVYPQPAVGSYLSAYCEWRQHLQDLVCTTEM